MNKVLCISEFQVYPWPSPLPGNCGAFVRLVCPRSGALANFAQCEGWVFANPGANPKLLACTCIPIQTYMEDFTENTITFKAHLSWTGKTHSGFLRHVVLILSLHFFIAYKARRQELSMWINTKTIKIIFSSWNEISVDLGFESV